MNVTIFCAHRESNDEKLLAIIRELGAYLAKHNHTLVYGASKIGLMKEIADAVLDNGGKVKGLGCKIYHQNNATYERLTDVTIYDTISERRTQLIQQGELYIALPGGIGTLDEITEVMELKRCAKDFPKVVFFNYDHFYETFKSFLTELDQKGYLKENDLSLYDFPETLEELLALIP